MASLRLRRLKEPVQRGRGATAIHLAKAAPVRVQEIVVQTGTLVVSKRRGGLQGSALWRVPEPATTKYRANGSRKATAILSAQPPPVRAQGIEGVRSSHTCRGFLPRRGTGDGRLVTTEFASTAGGAGAAEPRKARSA
jgi:hypothetical protein